MPHPGEPPVPPPPSLQAANPLARNLPSPAGPREALEEGTGTLWEGALKFLTFILNPAPNHLNKGHALFEARALETQPKAHLSPLQPT